MPPVLRWETEPLLPCERRCKAVLRRKAVLLHKDVLAPSPPSLGTSPPKATGLERPELLLSDEVSLTSGSSPNTRGPAIVMTLNGGLCDYFIVDVYHCCPVPVCRDHKVFEYRVLLVLIKPVLDTT